MLRSAVLTSAVLTSAVLLYGVAVLFILERTLAAFVARPNDFGAA